MEMLTVQPDLYGNSPTKPGNRSGKRAMLKRAGAMACDDRVDWPQFRVPHARFVTSFWRVFTRAVPFFERAVPFLPDALLAIVRCTAF